MFPYAGFTHSRLNVSPYQKIRYVNTYVREYTLSQKHFQCMKHFQNYLEKFPKLLGNIEEVENSK
jgi:hypothetical protein